MNNILSKILCAFFIVITSFPAKAAQDHDTTLLLANNNPNTPVNITRSVIKQANVIYPSTLQLHLDESLYYVEKYSHKNRAYLIKTYQKGQKYFPKIAAVLKQYNLPQELKILMAIESGFNANAVSGAGAVGYWQMMDDAAKEYGLKTGKKDDRKSFTKSTLAAAKYLRDRALELNNDLLLIVASYNCGIGNIRKAIRKTGKSIAGFWDIKKYLPAETKVYVMNFIALNVIFENYDKFIKNNLMFNSQIIEVPVSDSPAKLHASVID